MADTHHTQVRTSPSHNLQNLKYIFDQLRNVAETKQTCQNTFSMRGFLLCVSTIPVKFNDFGQMKRLPALRCSCLPRVMLRNKPMLFLALFASPRSLYVSSSLTHFLPRTKRVQSCDNDVIYDQGRRQTAITRPNQGTPLPQVPLHSRWS